MNAPFPTPAEEPFYLRGLNPPQREAVLTTEGPVLVLAGAGTGKTFTIAALATRYVAEGEAELSELMLVTFGRAATSELRDRVRESLVRTERALRDPRASGSQDPLVRHLAADGPEEQAARRHRLAAALAEGGWFGESHQAEALKDATVPDSDERIAAVQTGGCPHTAIRDDITANLDAIDDLIAGNPKLDLILVESGGDNLTATFSSGLVDVQLNGAVATLLFSLISLSVLPSQSFVPRTVALLAMGQLHDPPTAGARLAGYPNGRLVLAEKTCSKDPASSQEQMIRSRPASSIRSGRG